MKKIEIPEVVKQNRFDSFVSKTINFETGGDKSGAYTNTPGDKGGETKWGISKKAHPNLDIKNLTYPKACAIYHEFYYNPVMEEIVYDSLAFKLFDMSVLMGSKTAVKLLQRALNDTVDTYLREDGIIGPMTATALRIQDKKKLQMVYKNYLELIRNRLLWISLKPGNRKFYKGWLRRAEHLYDKI